MGLLTLIRLLVVKSMPRMQASAKFGIAWTICLIFLLSFRCNVTSYSNVLIVSIGIPHAFQNVLCSVGLFHNSDSGICNKKLACKPVYSRAKVLTRPIVASILNN